MCNVNVSNITLAGYNHVVILTTVMVASVTTTGDFNHLSLWLNPMQDAGSMLPPSPTDSQSSRGRTRSACA